MPSPFPGMDPYLEGNLWPDVHQTLTGEISRRLSRTLRPKYMTRLAVVAAEDDESPPEINLSLPGFKKSHAVPALFMPALPQKITPSLILSIDSQDRQVTVEIYDLEHNQLVTCIEILSPVNKRQPV